MESEALQVGATLVGVVSLATLIVREVFSYLRNKDSKNGNGNSAHLQTIFQELRTMNTNHLHSIEEAIRDGNQELIKTLNDNNRQSVELLGRIEGKLDIRR